MNPAPRPATADLRATLLTWGPIVAGLAFIYGPSFVDLFRRIWSTDEQAHGPIVLGVSCWLVRRNWPAMWARSEGAQTSAAGWPVVVIAAPTPKTHRHRTVARNELNQLYFCNYKSKGCAFENHVETCQEQRQPKEARTEL